MTVCMKGFFFYEYTGNPFVNECFLSINVDFFLTKRTFCECLKYSISFLISRTAFFEVYIDLILLPIIISRNFMLFWVWLLIGLTVNLLLTLLSCSFCFFMFIFKAMQKLWLILILKLILMILEPTSGRPTKFPRLLKLRFLLPFP